MSSATSLASEQPSSPLTHARTRAIVKDLFHPNPWVYWPDLLLTALVAHVCLGLTLRMDQLLPPEVAPAWLMWTARAVTFVTCGLAIYRAVMFIHEVSHRRDDELPGFREAYNVLCGVPFFAPSFLYDPHVDHHRRQHYGTGDDAEYVSFGAMHPAWSALYLLQYLFVPLLIPLRFGVLGPVSWFIPPLRRWVVRHASSLVINPFYRRRPPGRVQLRRMLTQEIGCFVVIAGLTVGAFVVYGRPPYPIMILGYCLAVFVLVINGVRTLGAHHYGNPGGEMTFDGQILDSVNYPHNPWVTGLWGPVGTRYHALHHLFPTMPYHHFPEAHRRLMRDLPADAAYRKTERRSLLAVVWQLFTHRRDGAKPAAA